MVYVDPETGYRPTTEPFTPGKQTNAMLAKFYLNELGVMDRMLHRTGLLSVMYIAKFPEEVGLAE